VKLTELLPNKSIRLDVSCGGDGGVAEERTSLDVGRILIEFKKCSRIN
jgi:hypothetical protein